MKVKSLFSASVFLVALTGNVHAGLFGWGDTPETPAAETKAPEPSTILGDAAVGTPQTLASVGMVPAKTIWVPGGYTQDGASKLYIGGKQFRTPEGFSNVKGFLPTEDGYLVAVFQPRVTQVRTDTVRGTPGLSLTQEMLARMTPEQQIAALQAQVKLMQSAPAAAPSVTVESSTGTGPGVVFYKVSPAGDILRVVGVVPGMSQVWVTRDAVYVSQEVGQGIFDVVGYTHDGTRVSGPQNVVYAVPGPSGEWYWGRLRTERDMRARDEYVTSKTGTVTQLMVGNLTRTLATTDYVQPEQIFIDLPPLSASVRTGTVMYYAFNGDAGALYVTTVADRKTIMVGRQRDIDNLHSLASRSVLFGSPKAAMYAGQAYHRKFKESGANIYVMSADTPLQNHYALYNLMGGAVNFSRMIIGSNNKGEFTMSQDVDLFGVITPATTVGINARHVAEGHRGFDLVNKRPVSPAELSGFIREYGLASE